MQGEGIFAQNYEEIRKGQEMNVTVDPVETISPLLFDPFDVKLVHRTDQGEINLIFYDDSKWTIKFNEYIWNQLKKRFDINLNDVQNKEGRQ